MRVSRVPVESSVCGMSEVTSAVFVADKPTAPKVGLPRHCPVATQTVESLGDRRGASSIVDRGTASPVLTVVGRKNPYRDPVRTLGLRERRHGFSVSSFRFFAGDTGAAGRNKGLTTDSDVVHFPVSPRSSGVGQEGDDRCRRIQSWTVFPLPGDRGGLRPGVSRVVRRETGPEP